jgi:hypothetical protein
MALGARHHFQVRCWRCLAVTQTAPKALALVGMALLSTCLLFAASAFYQDRPGSIQASIPARSHIYYAFLDSRFRLYFSSNTFSERFAPLSGEELSAPPQATVPAKPDVATTESLRPLQHSLPSLHSPPHRPAQQAALEVDPRSDAVHVGSVEDKKTIFEKIVSTLFRATSRPSPVKLAYATADDSSPGSVGSLVTSRYDQWTAVYDISARTVYMPDGTKLEAHSGLGDSLDDPAAVDQKDRGPTPPNVYNLQPRERPFHGVSALRLIPVDSDKTLGRTGLLAHSFMMGPHGDSNGCLSVKDYDAFLRAYTRHQIKRLVVVARLD